MVWGQRGSSDRVLVFVFTETRLAPIEGWLATYGPRAVVTFGSILIAVA